MVWLVYLICSEFGFSVTCNNATNIASGQVCSLAMCQAIPELLVIQTMEN